MIMSTWGERFHAETIASCRAATYAKSSFWNKPPRSSRIAAYSERIEGSVDGHQRKDARS